MTSTPTAFRAWFLLWAIIAGSFLPNLLRAQALVQPLHAFGFPESAVAQPCGRLIEHTNGKFVGISFAGGKDGYGSFFQMNRDGTGLIVLYSFYPTATNAGGPVYLIKGSDGRYYGVSRGGGKNGYGTVFSINADGSGCNVLYIFRGPSSQDGAFPNYLMEASDGTLFGTTDASLGTLFRLNKDGTGYSLVGGFGYTTGMLPKPGLFESSDGWLYGITWTWGTNYGGTIFKLRKDGSNFSIVRHLGPGDRNNNEPYSPQFLIQGSDGMLYVSCAYGSSSNDKGGIFKVSTNNTGFQLLHAFTGGTNDGAGPAQIMEASNGMIYGVCTNGGSGASPGNGVLFSMNKDGTGYSVLHRFAGFPGDGLHASACPIEAGDGLLYGSAPENGYGGDGLFYRLNKDGSAYTITAFCRKAGGDGETPLENVVEGTNGMLFGVTPGGGTNGYGTIFQVDRHGSNYSILRHFSKSTNDGAGPIVGLLLASDGALYGPTYSGGSNAPGGTIFKINQDGTGFQFIHFFTNSGANSLDPREPRSRLLEASDGLLYGTTAYGGTSNRGTIFRMNKNGANYTVLYSFNGGTGDGYEPNTGLVEAGNGLLFGTTEYGGANTNGVIFVLNKNGTGYTVLHHVTGPQSNRYPPNDLLVGSDGAIYGSSFAGAIFKINANGTGYREIYQLGTNGSPNSRLFERTDGYLYGTTGDRIFRLQKNGTDFGIIHRFFRDPSGANNLQGGVFFGQDGAMYGTSTTGGRVYVGGTVYRIPLWLITSRQEQVSFPGSNLLFTALAEGITPPCYQWRHDGVALPGQTNSTLLLTNVSLGDRGLYSVMASNTDGVVLSSNVFVHVLVPQQWAGPVLLPGGQLMIQSTYQGGGSVPWSEWSYFQLQTTTNLASPNWVPLDYVLTITNGNLIFIEHSVTNSPERFYRIMMR